MFNPQKLHPISYVSGLLQSIKSNLFPLIIGIFLVIRSGFDNIFELIFPGAILIFSVLGTITKSIKIYKTRYWIENDQLIMTWGVFSKNRKELNIARIQSMDTSQNIVHQILGGVNLSVKTASDGIELDTVTKKQSDDLSNYIKERKNKIKNANSKVSDNDADLNDEHKEELNEN